MNSKEYAVLYALMSGENAEPVNELAMRVEASPADVGAVLDGLCEQGILMSDISFHASDVGEIDYMFAFGDHAQAVYQRILDENPHLEKGESK